MSDIQKSQLAFTIQVVTHCYDPKTETLAVSSRKNYGKFAARREAHDLLQKAGWWSKGEPIPKDIPEEGLDEYDFRDNKGNMFFAQIEEFIDMADIADLPCI